MSRGLVTTSRYSPGNLSGETLEQLFVGRSRLLEDVLSRIVASATRKEKHHILLVGQRGIGKTHFVSLLSYRLATRSEYAEARERLRIAHLSEDEWGIASYLDFLVRILRSLAAEPDGAELEAEIEQVHSAFTRGHEVAHEVAQRLIRKHVSDGALLLICENLADLLDALGEEGQRRWRAFIQETSFWIILATTPSLSQGLRLHSSPFYGFFSVKPLDGLEFTEAVELLRRKALLDGRSDLAQLLATPLGRARVRAIHHLAGGNHRVYVTMSEFLNKESLQDLVTPFLRMVDDLTPYYQDRMRQLAPAQRKIVDALCREVRPLIVKSIASRCLMSPQTAAKQLGELAELRFVTHTRVGRESHYELAEPLMRICVEVKDKRTEHLHLFVEFLRRWFTSREIQTRFELLRNSDPKGEGIDCSHLRVALDEYQKHKNEPFLDSLHEEIYNSFEAKDWQGLLVAASRMIAERDQPRYHLLVIYALIYQRQYSEALERAQAAMKRSRSEAGPFLFCQVPVLAGLGRQAQARQLLSNKSCISSDEVDVCFDVVLILKNQDETELALLALDVLVAKAPEKRYLRCMRGTLLFKLDRFEEVIQNERYMLEKEPDHHHSFLLVTGSLLFLRRYSEAEQQCRAFLRSAPDDRWLLIYLSRALSRQGRFEEALDAAESGLRSHPDQGELFCARGEALFGLGRYEEVLLTEDQVLRANPSHYHSYAMKVETLLRLSRPEDAVEVARTWVKHAADDLYAWDRLAQAHYENGQMAEALDVLEKGLAVHANSPELLRGKILALHELGRDKEIPAIITLLKEAKPKLSLGARVLHDLESMALPDAALELLDGLLEDFPSHSPFWLERAHILCVLGRYEEAVNAASRARELAPDDIGGQLAEAEALVGFNGLAAGVRAYDKVLSQLPASEPLTGKTEEILTRAATALMTCELKERGAMSLARQSPSIREAFERHEKVPILAAALTRLLKHLLKIRNLAAEEWGPALRLLQGTWGSLQSCRIPLEMLSVAVRYTQTQDTIALLSLPLEQRALLTEYLGESVPTPERSSWG